MGFTYIGDLSTDLDIIRFEIGDTVEDAGIKPDNSNYSDEEINGILAIEGATGYTIARLYANIALLYAPFVDTKIGPRDEKLSQRGKMYALLAKQWREDYPPLGASMATGYLDFDFDQDEDNMDDDSDEDE
jgi:hypothetical protein